MSSRKLQGKKLTFFERLDPFRLFGKTKVIVFISIVLLLTIAIISYFILDTYRERKIISQLQDRKTTFTLQEYNFLLRSPTIQDYIFPEDPRNFYTYYQPWRNSFSLEERKEALDKLWVDPLEMEFIDLPDRSRQNIRDYISHAQSIDPSF